MSLGRGFMYAGAPSIIMTLWPLSDASGPFLIKHLYEGLADGLAKDEALRQAKLKYLEAAGEKTSHPFFWASFITLGDNSPIYVAQRGFLSDYGLYLFIGIVLLGGLGYGLRRKKQA